MLPVLKIKLRLSKITLLLLFLYIYHPNVSFANLPTEQPVNIPCSIQWPVKTKYVTNLSSTFGESRLDHFHNGIDIAGYKAKIYPVEDGDILYKTRENIKLGEIPWGGGNTIIIKHQKCISGYMHLDSFDNSLQKLDNFVRTTESIGESGNTGHSVKPHLHFFLTNKKMDTIYNPLLVLDNTYYKDQRPPIERGYYVKIEDHTINFNPNKKIILSQNFPLYLKVDDQGVDNEHWGIYEFQVFHVMNTKPIQHVIFDYISLKKGNWYTSNTEQTIPKIFSEVYFQNYYYLGNSFQDNYYLSWIAKGLQGPSNKKEYKLNIITK